jgi:hypothetical protein
MKRSLFLILASLLAFGTLVGCEDDDETEDTTDVIDSTEETDDSTDETDDSTDDSGETPVTDACTTTANEEAFSTYVEENTESCTTPGDRASTEATQNCQGLNCVAGTCSEEQVEAIATCVGEGLEDFFGIGADCGGCFGTLVACVIDNGCAIPCQQDAGGEECTTCRTEAGCDADLLECAGVPSDYDPCTSGE